MAKRKGAKGEKGRFTIGVIGCGYWGPNLLCNFNQLPGAGVKYCCDLNDDRLAHMKALYPHLIATKDLNDVIRDKEVDAVVVATPVSSHYAIGKACLEAGKHVLLEKPLTQSAAQAEDLIRIASRDGRRVVCRNFHRCFRYVERDQQHRSEQRRLRLLPGSVRGRPGCAELRRQQRLYGCYVQPGGL